MEKQTWNIIVDKVHCPFFNPKSNWNQCANWKNKTYKCIQKECPLKEDKEDKPC